MKNLSIEIKLVKTLKNILLALKKTLLSVPVEYINKTIESMNNQLSIVVKNVVSGKCIRISL